MRADPFAPRYIHGTHPEEQARLTLLNEILNASSLRALRLRPGDRVLDVGSGLGQLTRAMARQVQPGGVVIGIERDPAQLAEAERQAAEARESGLAEFRQGSSDELPLDAAEVGSFDVVHARFLLEHLPAPQRTVAAMVRAARPGGRIVVEDDDHDLLRVWPPEPDLERLWAAYIVTWGALGNEPYIGRRLVSMLGAAGAEPRRSDMLFFGGCAGQSTFPAYVTNFRGILVGARAALLDSGSIDAAGFEAGIAAFDRWSRQPDASLWYATCWAEALRPPVPDASVEATPASAPERHSSGPGGHAAARRHTAAPQHAPDLFEPSSHQAMFAFLAESAADLSSTLRLDEVFGKIARRVSLLLDTHLFCIMLWNEAKGLLEHSYSMKFGQHIEQSGGFPLGYGLSGCAARDLQPIRVADVRQDPRYVRFRHAEVEVRSELAVPLICDGRLVGVLDLESIEPEAFGPEHETVISALAGHIASALENARLYETVRRNERRLESDLATARQIQRGLLAHPPRQMAGLEIGVAHTAAEELSGDFYDFLPFGDGRMVVALGDVAGKSTPAALLASLAVGMLRGQVLASRGRPAEILTRLNEQLRHLDLEHRFVALLLGLWDPGTHRLALANSGVPQPIRFGTPGAEVVDVTGLPLGRMDGPLYEEREIELVAGDVVVFVSDGIEDATGRDGEALGAAGIERTLAAAVGGSAQQIADALIAAAGRWVSEEGAPADDRTVLVLRLR